MRRLAAALVLLVCGCSTDGGSTNAHASRVVATPEPTGTSTVSVDIAEPTPTERTVTRAPAPERVRAAQVAPKAASKPVPLLPKAGIGAFKRLGAWIDVFDHTDDPATIVPLVQGAAAKGAKTLYLESARATTPGVFQYPTAMGAALDEAKALGMKVIAWYPPDFKDVAKDLKRSVAAIKYRSPKGNRFDGFGADIEYTAGVPDHEKRNKRTIEYSKKLRKAAGALYPMSAIVIPPSWLERNTSRWPDFPWAQIKGSYDLFMPMEYWTALGKDTKTAYEVTKYDTQKTRALTGLPVHIIGGLGADADGKQVASYVKAAKESGSIGGGLYDYRTTRSDVWDELRVLN